MSLTQQKPDVSEAADFSKKMTLQEKLDFIDGEIRKIHVFCTKSGYSATQIEQFAKPFFEKENNSICSTIWVSGKAWKRRVVALITMVVATVFLFRYDPAYQLASALSKQGAIQ
ncbi:Dat protein, partial [Biomphalaria glabrata]